MTPSNAAIAPIPGTLATVDDPILRDEKLWQVVSSGDLKGLTDSQKAAYYLYRCRQEGLNPASQPFQYLTLQGKEILYGGKTAADQLRKLHGISIVSVTCTQDDEYIEFEIRVRDREGREDYETGVVFVGQAKGVERANARMKCLTKAKRRATFSICGTGVLDETEVETIPQSGPERPAQAAQSRPALPREAIDANTGEIETAAEVAADVKEAREALGWSTGDVVKDAGEQGINTRTIAGLLQMRDRLQAMVTRESRGVDLNENAGLALDAAYAVAGEAGSDRYTER